MNEPARGDTSDRGLPIDVPNGWPVPPEGCRVHAMQGPSLLEACAPLLYVLANYSERLVSALLDESAIPKVVPMSAMRSTDAFAEWLEQAHGLSGRLLLADGAGAWWVVIDTELAVTFVSGPLRLIESAAGATPGDLDEADRPHPLRRDRMSSNVERVLDMYGL